MLVDVVGAALEHAQAARGLVVQQATDQLAHLLRQVADPRMILRERGEHLVEEDAERPPVAALAVALVRHGAQVVERAAQRVQLVADLLDEAEVGDLEGPI